MNDDEREGFRKVMRKVDSRRKQRVDSELIDLRQIYERLSRDERYKLRTWMEMVSDAKDQMPLIGLDIGMKIEFREQVGEDEFNTVSLPILAIKRAFEFWDRGEDYAPTGLDELSG